ncbi:AAA family ATPase [Bacillus wiedmannii]|uniref:AAA family ATPase n=3 Tax=Bacillus cereus group TaxID=86661 RepID=UPI0020D26FA6|nr:AAA family ATPase [Bacillus wiedmannii]
MVPFSMQNKKEADSLLKICYFRESKLLDRGLLSVIVKTITPAYHQTFWNSTNKEALMKTILIIIRGNSGSGKSTVARQLQLLLEDALLVPQDVVRRDILRVKDTVGNLSVELIKQIALYGMNKVNYVIVEGILSNSKYKTMLTELIDTFEETHIYYYDISLKETIARHKTKPNKNDFGQAELAAWYIAKDFLDLPNEKTISETMTVDETVKMIISDIETVSKTSEVDLYE